jgi:hypothetical protein
LELTFLLRLQKKRTHMLPGIIANLVSIMEYQTVS